VNTAFRPNYLSIALSAVAASFALVACGPQNGAPTAAATPAAATTADPAQTPPAAGQPVPAVAAATPAPVQAPVVQAQAVPAVPPVVQVAQATPAVSPPPPVASAYAGSVVSIEPIRTRPPGTGTGAVIGGVLGAVVGNQFGGGSGRVATTALGAVGGAVVGNNVERNHNEGIAGYRVSVRLDNGHSRTFQESHVDGLRVGDRVRIEGGQLRPV
jgi:outer membrane lipoprotein SlyB